MRNDVELLDGVHRADLTTNTANVAVFSPAELPQIVMSSNSNNVEMMFSQEHHVVPGPSQDDLATDIDFAGLHLDGLVDINDTQAARAADML